MEVRGEFSEVPVVGFPAAKRFDEPFCGFIWFPQRKKQINCQNRKEGVLWKCRRGVNTRITRPGKIITGLAEPFDALGSLEFLWTPGQITDCRRCRLRGLRIPSCIRK